MGSTCTACGKELAGGRFCPHCGASVAPLKLGDPLLGQVLGNFKVLRPLAEGGMGKLYVGEQLNLGRLVCIKTLLPEHLGDASVLARFEREAKAVSSLRHPNIAQVYDFGRSGDAFYLVMELIEGTNLRVLLQQEAPLPLERACTITTQILSALEEAHAAAIVHRDLKPENVLLARLRDGSDLVKVVDFGIAKAVDARQPNLTATGLVCGTPGYMAPEQIAGEALDQRADVYAAGCILFELLTGKPPFPGPSVQDLIRQHLGEEPPPPSTATSMPLSREVDALLLRALAKEPGARIASALDFKRELELLKPGRGTQQVSAAGLSVTVSCPSCNTANPAGQKFCGSCGAPMAPGAAPRNSSAGLESLKKLMPGQLVEHLGNLQDALSAERRHVTVVFGDISGFTTMSETMDPEQVREVMNRAFDGMVEAVARYDGTVDKFIGDAVMVLFGAPTAHEDDPERAVRCALDMQGYLDHVNQTLARPLKMRIGINTGEVVAGGVGGQRRMDYTVMGDVVNVAQRIESHATPGKILVSASVKRLTDKVVKYRTLDPVKVKGKSDPIAVYEVEALTAATASTEPLVGRGNELTRVQQLLAQAKSGKAAGFLFLGEPGIGKSRLLEEALQLAQASGMRVGTARPRRMLAPAQLELLRDALFSLVGGLPLHGSESDARLGALVGLGADPMDVKRLQHLFGSGPAQEGYEREESRRLDCASVVQALLDIARKSGGLCLVLDDLHLADSSSLGHLDDLIGAAGAVPLAIIGAARPGETDRLLKRMQRGELKPLASSELRQMVQQQLEGELPDSVAETILARAEGSPFIAKELVRTLIDNGSLQLRGGAWRVTSTQLALPQSVGQLLTARVDGLSPGAKQLLRYAAVHGRVFPVELVAAAVGGAPGDVQAALAECTNRGFIAHVDLPGCMQFRQELVQQAVLSGIAHADLRHIHAALADSLERGLSSGDSHPAEALARHFLGAGKTRKAATYYSMAAERLSNKSAFLAACDSYLKAVALADEELNKTPGDLPAWSHYAALVSKAVSVQGLVAPADALKLAERALQKAPSGVTKQQRAEVVKQRGLLELKLGRPADAELSLTEALADGSTELPADARAALEIDLASAKESKGDFTGATFLLLEALKRLAGLKVGRDLVWKALNQLGRVHLRLGQGAKALEFFENAAAQARQARSGVGEARALSNLASALSAGGDAASADKAYAQALEVAQKAGDRIDVARIEYNLGRLALSGGKHSEARQRLQHAYELANLVAWREGMAAASQALEALKGRG